MKKRKLPIIVTTEQALQSCLKASACVIYIDGTLYEKCTERIRRTMMLHGYTIADIPAQRGVFYTRNASCDKWEIYDPYQLF